MSDQAWVKLAEAARRIGMTAPNLRRLIRLKRVEARRRGEGKTCAWYLPASEVARLEDQYGFAKEAVAC